jgi:hypothetical protein
VQGALVLIAYGIVSAALWGSRLVPGFRNQFLTGPGNGNDVRFYTWALSWWPHAIGHGLNPLHAGVAWAPHGVNMTWLTGIPGPSVVMAPVTFAFGPVMSENLLFIMAPPLAGWAAYLLCRRVTRSFWPAVAGGYLFGFSTYMVGQMRGHVNLVLVFPVALAAYLIVRRLEGSMSERRLVILLALVVLAQFSIAVEVTVGMVTFGALGLLLAWLVLGGEWRRRIVRVAAASGIACLLVVVVVSPYLITAFRGHPTAHFTGSGQWTNAQYDVYLQHYSTDLLSFVIPTEFVAARFTQAPGVRAKFRANVHEDGAYAGLPLLALVVLFAILRRRRRSTWLLVGLFLLAVLMSLGPVLHIAGHSSIRLPWSIAESLPVLKEALPIRLAVYIWLALAVIAAVWLAEPKEPRQRWIRPARWALVAVGAAAILPSIPRPTPLVVPAVFASNAWTRVIRPGENVMALPLYSPSGPLVWQARTGFGFNLSGGYVGYRAIPSEAEREPGFFGLVTNHPELVTPADLAAFVHTNAVGAVMISSYASPQWRRLLATLGVKPTKVDNLLIYRLQPRALTPAP